MGNTRKADVNMLSHRIQKYLRALSDAKSRERNLDVDIIHSLNIHEDLACNPLKEHFHLWDPFQTSINFCGSNRINRTTLTNSSFCSPDRLVKSPTCEGRGSGRLRVRCPVGKLSPCWILSFEKIGDLNIIVFFPSKKLFDTLRTLLNS